VNQRDDVEVKQAAKAAIGAGGRHVIAVIGIDRYRHWPPLSNAVRDASGAAALFRRLGFEEITAPLLDDRATGKAIQSLVTDDLMTLEPGDSLVLFYAGHGSTRKHRLGDEVIKAGYLIPVDAAVSPDKVSTWVDLEGWLRAVSLLPARHILVVLDACHSGIALDPIIKWRDIGLWQDAPLATLQARRSRRIITSALDDQIALDSGPVHGHSLFTGCLMEGLTDGIARGGSRVTTGSELGLYVQRRVQTYPNSRQTPDFGTFAFDDRGEMVIPLVIERPEDPATTAGVPDWIDLIDLDDKSEILSVAEPPPGDAASDTAVEAAGASMPDAEPMPRPSVGSDKPAPALEVESPPGDAGVPIQSNAPGLLSAASPAPSPPPQPAVPPRTPEPIEPASVEVVAMAASALLPAASPAPSQPPQGPVPPPAQMATIALSPERAEPVSVERVPAPAPGPHRSKRSTPSLPPLPPTLPSEIAKRLVPTPDARRWIVVGVVSAVLSAALIGYLLFDQGPSRGDSPAGPPPRITAADPVDAPAMDTAPSAVADRPPDAPSRGDSPAGPPPRVAAAGPVDAPAVDTAPSAVADRPPDAPSRGDSLPGSPPRVVAADPDPVFARAADAAPGAAADHPADTPSRSSGPPAGGCPSGMVSVPAGAFWMGSAEGLGDADEHPQHEVTLSAYCIDQTEVTVQAYADCVRAGGCKAAPLTVQWSRVSAEDVKRYSRFCNRGDRPEHPINCVDWYQAMAYCMSAGKRLPTEAEWEHAARGRDGRVYPWGNQGPSARRLNACGSECVAMLKRELNLDWPKMYPDSDRWEATAPVGNFPEDVSPFGALDMAGNVSEWTADWYGTYPEAAAPGAKTVRGGGWDDSDAARVRAADRGWNGPSTRAHNIGFRCVRGH
jgi:sulfatase modifying factor 1